MNRPSHWILAFLVVTVATLWGTGAIDGVRPAAAPGSGAGGGGAPGRVVTMPDRRPPAVQVAHLRGRVVDRLGWPVGAAEVRVEGERGVVMTDTDGWFDLTLAGGAHRRLRIDAQGRHEPIIARASVDPILVVAQDATPWRSPATVQKSESLLFGEGFVVDAEGNHVVGARVSVSQTGSTVVTNEIGRFLVPLPTDAVELVSWDGIGGFARVEIGPAPRPQGKVPLPRIQLAAGVQLTGRVRDADGEPLVGVGVLAENAGVHRVETTREGGMFAFAGLDADEVMLTVLPHRGHLGSRRLLRLEGGDVDAGDVVLERPSQRPLRIQVIDPHLTPQPGLHVVADQDSGLHRAYGRTDELGFVSLPGLRLGDTEFEVRDQALEPVNVVGYDDVRSALVVVQ